MDYSIVLAMIKRWTNQILKSVSDNHRVATEKIISAITEAARTISYVETVSNKADTLHRHLKKIDEETLKKAFEFNTRRAIGRMGLGRVTLAIDPTIELYYGKNGKLNVRQKKHEDGTDEAFFYAVLSVVEPKPLPLMAIPYRQGDNLTSIVKDMLEYAKTLPFQIELALFDRGFYIGELIEYLSSQIFKYLIFVRETGAIKKFIAQTDRLASFEHVMEWNKDKTHFYTKVKIVVIFDKIIRKGKEIEYYWCFATNLRQGLYLIFKYKQRWQIETDFRVHDEARIKSKSNNPIIRYFYFLTSLLLMANWEVNRLLHPEICFKKYLKLVQEQFEKAAVT
jgi:hypothetical protein